MASEEKLREIRDRVRIEELVRDYNVVLQPAGSRLRGLCPFHREKTPSFFVSPEYQYFRCFGCDAKGDVFSFVQRSENVAFPESIQLLAQRCGVTLDDDRQGGGSRRRGEKTAIFEALERADALYHRILMEDPRGEPARRYLERRGIDRSMWKRFRLGFAPPGWSTFTDLARKEGLSPRVIELAGLARRRQDTASDAGGASFDALYDYFRNRVMFPIADGLKRVVGFGARTLGDDKPKYLNTAKTPVFDKSQVLYGLPLARKAIQNEKALAIVEGYTDVIAAHQAGLEHFVASLGTAFTSQNARQLRRLAPRVELVFDGDTAGQSAAERSLDLLVAEDLDVRIYTVVDGKDPCDTIQALGGEAFYRQLQENSIGIFEFKWKRTVGALGESRDGAASTGQALDEVLSLLLKVPNPVTRELHARDTAEKLGVSVDGVLRRLASLESRGRKRVAGSGSPGRDATTASPEPSTPLAAGTAPAVENPSVEEVVVECLLADPAQAARRWQELPGDFFKEPETRRLAAAMRQQIDAGGEPRGDRLLRDLVGEPEAVQALVRILERIERVRGGATGRANGAGSTSVFDPEEKWTRCMRDVERLDRRRRRRDLGRRKTLARERGDVEALRAAEKETLEYYRKWHREPRAPAQ